MCKNQQEQIGTLVCAQNLPRMTHIVCRIHGAITFFSVVK